MIDAKDFLLNLFHHESRDAFASLVDEKLFSGKIKKAYLAIKNGGDFATVTKLLEQTDYKKLSDKSLIGYAESLQRDFRYSQLNAVIDDVRSSIERRESEQTIVTKLVKGALSIKSVEQAQTLRAVLNKTVEKIDRGEAPLEYLSSGIKKLDDYGIGFPRKLLSVVAGRPGHGKSAFVRTLATNQAVNKKKTLYFSIEDSDDMVAMRFISDYCDLPIKAIQNAKTLSDSERKRIKVAESKWGEVADRIILETASVDCTDVYIKGLNAILSDNVDCIMFDYAQVIKHKEGEIREAINRLVETLIELGKFNVAVILGSQLKRPPHEEPGELFVPSQSDLKETGVMEQRAKGPIIALVDPHRHAVDGVVIVGKTEVTLSKDKRCLFAFVLKNSNGDWFTVEPLVLDWEPEYTRIR